MSLCTAAACSCPSFAPRPSPLFPHVVAPQEELASYELMDPEDRPKFIPQSFKSLREVRPGLLAPHLTRCVARAGTRTPGAWVVVALPGCSAAQVPMYGNYVRDIFERCLDLYLCPRVSLRHWRPSSRPQAGSHTSAHPRALPSPLHCPPPPAGAPQAPLHRARGAGAQAAQAPGPAALPHAPGHHVRGAPGQGARGPGTHEGRVLWGLRWPVQCAGARGRNICLVAACACVQVRSCAVDPTGQWLLSGGDDGTARVWEVRGVAVAKGGRPRVMRRCIAWTRRCAPYTCACVHACSCLRAAGAVRPVHAHVAAGRAGALRGVVPPA